MPAKVTVYLDMDGLLAEFSEPAARLHGIRESIPYAARSWNFWEQAGLTAAEFWAPIGFDFWNGLPVHPDGMRLLGKLRTLGPVYSGEVRLKILTSPITGHGDAKTGESVAGKLAWARRHLGAGPGDVVFSSAKGPSVGGPAKVLVDDHGDNCQAFADAGGSAILVPRPWNARAGEQTAVGEFDVDAILGEVRHALALEAKRRAFADLAPQHRFGVVASLPAS